MHFHCCFPFSMKIAAIWFFFVLFYNICFKNRIFFSPSWLSVDRNEKCSNIFIQLIVTQGTVIEMFVCERGKKCFGANSAFHRIYGNFTRSARYQQVWINIEHNQLLNNTRMNFICRLMQRDVMMKHDPSKLIAVN